MVRVAHAVAHAVDRAAMSVQSWGQCSSVHHSHCFSILWLQAWDRQQMARARAEEAKARQRMEEEEEGMQQDGVWVSVWVWVGGDVEVMLSSLARIEEASGCGVYVGAGGQ